MTSTSNSGSDLADRLLKGDTRALARALTLVENADPVARELVDAVYQHTGKAFVLGVTGPPGVGKSTLVDALAKILRPEVGSLAILAFDPSSPFTGGALLGDRARMEAGSRDPAIFIRSVATRGHIGGLAGSAFEAIALLDAAGKSLILIETIGVGQDEVEIASTADMTLVVLAPGMGDDLQANKAGLMEIGDRLIVNKADRAGADQLVDELRSLVEGTSSEKAREVFTTTATTGEGVDEVASSILQKMTERDSPSDPGNRKSFRRFHEMWLRERVRHAVLSRLAGSAWDDALAALEGRSESPYDIADRLLNHIASDSQGE